MRASSRNQRVTFYRKVTTQNSSGEDIVTNSELGAAWVAIRPLRGQEREQGQQLTAEAQFEITMEHPLEQYTLRSNDIATWGTRTLDLIVPEDPDGRRRQVVMYAKEYVP